MIDSIPSRSIYENGGWKDGRLGQAYDLIASVLQERGIRLHRHELLGQLEALDDESEQECAA